MSGPAAQPIARPSGLAALHGAVRRSWESLLGRLGIDPRWPWPLWLIALLFVPPSAPAHAAGARRPQPAWTTRIGPRELLRLLMQALWLALVRPPREAAAGATRQRDRAAQPDAAPGVGPGRKAGAGPSVWRRQVWRTARRVGRVAASALSAPPRWFARYFGERDELEPGLALRSCLDSRPVLWIAAGAAAALGGVAVTTPLDSGGQAVLGLLLWGVALLVRRAGGLSISLLLIALSLFASTRYLWWRVAYTLRWDDPLALAWGLLLLLAEGYAWLMLLLGYFQTAMPLRRPSVPLPADVDCWPTVDIYVPTYNEPMSVVSPTVVAALALDWPRDKLRVHVLDDGRRPECKAMAQALGANYLTRPDNRHAKAGNLNHAMTVTSAEFIAIFDCDHVPTRTFLQRVMGAFLRDDALALVQTPHHFFSPDPFERNLARFRRIPNEGELFHGLIQDGNDLWNAAFFCGSCAVLRRSAVQAIGGFAVETVTEDAHTALRLQRRGFNTALVNDVLAAGLATESLSAHIGQRIRWARGMAQILRLDNPLFGPGLSWAQRICYGSAMLHFFNGGPRLVFLTAPIAFLLAGVYVIHAAPQDVLLYALPHMILASIANSRLQGAHRGSFWSEVYETVLAWYIARPTAVALFAPRKGKFNVTVKGGGATRAFFDWQIAAPFLLLAALNATAFAFGVQRLVAGPADEAGTALLNMVWTVCNLLLIGAAIAVAAEPQQRRHAHRAAVRVPVVVLPPGQRALQASTQDISLHGAAIRLAARHGLAAGDALTVTLPHGREGLTLHARVTAATPRSLRMRWAEMSDLQRQALVQGTLGRGDAWSQWALGRPPDRLLASLLEVLGVGLGGYRRLAHHALRAGWRRFGPLRRRLRTWRRSSGLGLLAQPPALASPQALLEAIAARAASVPALQGRT